MLRITNCVQWSRKTASVSDDHLLGNPQRALVESHAMGEGARTDTIHGWLPTLSRRSSINQYFGSRATTTNSKWKQHLSRNFQSHHIASLRSGKNEGKPCMAMRAQADIRLRGQPRGWGLTSACSPDPRRAPRKSVSQAATTPRLRKSRDRPLSCTQVWTRGTRKTRKLASGSESGATVSLLF